MLRAQVLLVLGLPLILSLDPAAGAAAQPALMIERVEAEDCQQIPPEETPPLAISYDPRLNLDVRVLAERGDRPTVKERMSTTETAFARIGIDLKVSYDRVSVPQAWKNQGDLLPDASSDEHFELMKQHYGGERPEGVDVVYFFSRYWGGGMADCIGGVRFPDRAFAFGSIDYALESVVPMPTVDEGVIAAHEIGHLLGAHHHYSNCSEAGPKAAIHGEAAACTTMSPLATTASSIFGLLEGSFIRDYASEYAQN